LKPTFAPLSSSVAAANVRQRLLSSPETLYRRTFSSVRQRHSAEQVKKSRQTHSGSSRVADVLSLECSRQQLSGPVKVDRSLSSAVPSTILISGGQLPSIDNTSAASTCTGFDLVQTAAASSRLILASPSLQQLSFPADESGLFVVSGSQCNSSVNMDLPLTPRQSGLVRTPGDFPSNLLLAPIPAPDRQLQPHSADPPRVSGTTATIVLWPFVWDYPGEPIPEETFTHPPS